MSVFCDGSLNAKPENHSVVSGSISDAPPGAERAVFD